MLSNLQAVRALAALGVVLFHFGLMPATALPFRVGAFGVDLFFVLSGFIIAHSSARDRRHFLAHRLIRVLPSYWIATVLAALFTLQALDEGAALGWLVQSLFYLPGPGGRPPLIFVGWTLVYELGFYLLYWAALRFGTRVAPLVAPALLAALAVPPLPGGPWPLLLEFALGVGVHLVAERSRAPSRLPAWAGPAVAALGLALLLILPPLTGYDLDDGRGAGRVLCWGAPAAAVILGAVLAERAGAAIRNRPLLLLGAASYQLYLLHPIVLGQLMRLPPVPAPLSWLWCALAAALTAALSVAAHLWIEAPLLTRLRALLRDRAPVVERATPAARSGTIRLSGRIGPDTGLSGQECDR